MSKDEAEKRVAEIMAREQRATVCQQAINDALASYGCRLVVTATLTESGTQFRVTVAPTE